MTVTAVDGSGFDFSSWSGDLTGSTNPTTITMNGNKVVEAVFAPAPNCTTVNLTAAEDTYMSAGNTNYNNGGTLDLHVDNTTGTSRRGTLLRWNVGSIPTNATVSSASFLALCHRRQFVGFQSVCHAA